MFYRHVHEINEKNQILISLPESFKRMKRVMVIVEDAVNANEEKLQLLRQASQDPLFLADVKGIQDDFEHTDKEAI